ncbi:hypothetical protein HBA54_13710 [Pelagibius litoralis]|uniref:Blue (type 1) copper domain-containing protein n=1 Tax=Pelagibius litoralis TaxID=374515 RepID=A0A967EYA0_9PROT|nr:plastocyanin/azurin family copper-binding protein [Pelagibius litoralis]NIA69653.1 hypothetical protein [Pelagibius litoralis]
MQATRLIARRHAASYMILIINRKISTLPATFNQPPTYGHFEMRVVFFVMLMTALMLSADPAKAGQTVRIDQITDTSATAASGMFRFSPNLIWIEAGESVTFLNSRSHHTVHSVPALWPEAVAPVAIAHKPEAIVRFDQEGFYGFTCRRHGQYGMVMLVIVGAPEDRKTFTQKIESMRASKREKTAFNTLIQRSLAGPPPSNRQSRYGKPSKGTGLSRPPSPMQENRLSAY